MRVRRLDHPGDQPTHREQRLEAVQSCRCHARRLDDALVWPMALYQAKR